MLKIAKKHTLRLSSAVIKGGGKLKSFVNCLVIVGVTF